MTQERFVALLERCTLHGRSLDARALYEEVHALYSGAGRHYHTVEHLDHCLSRFDMCSGLMVRPEEVEVALWYHDAIYRPGAPDNELRSAELFAARAGDACAADTVARVHELIMATTHREPPVDLDAQLVVDIDLSGFGLPWDDFARDSEAVRAEFAHQDDAAFYATQIRFLRSLIERERFFTSDFFHERYEQQARENVERTLARLAAAGFE